MEDRFKTFTVLITKLYRAIRKIKNEETEEYGLTNPHVSCLYYLYQAQKLTLTELIDICLEDKAVMSKAITYLEKIGLIICETNQKKRYKSYFELTDNGLIVAKSIVAKIENILDFASADIYNNDRSVMYKSLLSISNKLDELCSKYEEN